MKGRTTISPDITAMSSPQSNSRCSPTSFGGLPAGRMSFRARHRRGCWNTSRIVDTVVSSFIAATVPSATATRSTSASAASVTIGREEDSVSIVGATTSVRGTLHDTDKGFAGYTNQRQIPPAACAPTNREYTSCITNTHVKACRTCAPNTKAGWPVKR